MDELLSAIGAKKQRLDALRPVSRAALLALQKSYDVELTYTSNAIEGNTLTLRGCLEDIDFENAHFTSALVANQRSELDARIVFKRKDCESAVREAKLDFSIR